jgi:ligand-binding sensor domain-containing protein
MLGVLFFLHFSLSAVSQSVITPQPVFENYTSDNGLPSSEIYHSYQDSLGYIWFATSNGVSRFDGNTFENYDLDNGLVDNTIEEIYPDFKGRLWFISSSGKLAYYEKGTIHPYPFNNKIQKLITSTRGPVKKSFFIDRSENIYISFKKFGCLKISKEGIVQKITSFYDEGVVVIDRFINGNALIVTPQKPSANLLYYSDGENKYVWDYQKEAKKNIVFNFHNFASFLPNNSLLFSGWGFLFQLNKGKVEKKVRFDSEIIWLSVDNQNNIWVAPSRGGVVSYPNADIEQKPSLQILSDIQVTSVMTDRENGVWFTTLNNGVYYTNSINAKTYSKEDDFSNLGLSSIYAKNNRIYVGFDNGTLGIIENSKISYSEPALSIYFPSTIRDIVGNQENDDIWVLSSYAIHNLSNNNFTHFIRTLNNYLGIHPRQIVTSIKGDFLIASAQGLKRFDGKNITYDSFHLKEFSAVVNSVFEKPNGEVLLGCANGLWSYNGKSYSYLGENEPLLSKRILSIAGSNDGRIYFGTKGLGLIVMNTNGTLFQLSKKDGIASKTINQVYFDGEYIWLATSEGATQLRVNANGSYSALEINKSKGLPTNDVQRIFRFKNNILIATRKGLTILDVNEIKPNTVAPLCHITKVMVNNSEVAIISEHLDLNYNQNLIDFHFKGLSFISPSDQQYRYRLLGLDSTWVYTKNTNAIFSNLPSNDYAFQIQAQNTDGIWSSLQELNIFIDKPFWKTYWFNILFALLFSSLLFLIYILRVKAIKKRNDLINTTHLYKQQSLRQQMNPHFIFNTLNSIQLYILENDAINSHKYLTKFARLIRLTLDNSQESVVLIKDEVEALKLYLELESLRLEGKFDYSIDIEDLTILDLKIPTLLIQPFVENSIWHGIMLKESQTGRVNIKIEQQKGSILCSIEDNGVGRKKANHLRDENTRKHKSLGYKITSQRIELLNLIYSDKFKVVYKDLIDENQQSRGTRVEITIPIG